MPRKLAEGTVKACILTEKPADLTAVTLAEATAGKDISDWIIYSTYQAGAQASETVAEKPLSKKGNANALGSSNYQVQFSIFRDLDENGQPVAAGDIAFGLFKEKGQTVWLLERRGPDSPEPWAASQEYSIYELLTDNPQTPDNLDGYQKLALSPQVQDAELFKTLGAGV